MPVAKRIVAVAGALALNVSMMTNAPAKDAVAQPSVTTASDIVAQPVVTTVIDAGEAAALAALYNATGGDGWTTRDQWLIAGTQCTWFGITCSADGAHVTRIQLDYNNLAGSLPSNLFSSFPSLEFLSVSGNRLTGSVPAFGGTPNLHYVAIDANAFTGSIPSFNGLTNLIAFYAGANQLSGAIPTLAPALTGLANLEDFEVYGNHLTGSIPSLDGLTNLAYFNVAGNKLTGTIPASLSAATKMNHFEVSNNLLTGTIPSLTAMTNLSYFYVDGNLLSGAVPAVANPSPLAAATLCPNFLSTAPSANDLAWNQATGLYPDPWWSERHSRCDILFRQGFGYNE